MGPVDLGPAISAGESLINQRKARGQAAVNTAQTTLGLDEKPSGNTPGQNGPGQNGPGQNGPGQNGPGQNNNLNPQQFGGFGNSVPGISPNVGSNLSNSLLTAGSGMADSASGLSGIGRLFV